MRHIYPMALVIALLWGCQEESPASGKGSKPNPETAVLPMYTYDAWEVPLTYVEVGDTVLLDVSQLTYDTSKEYIWTAWTGEERGGARWNRPALGADSLELPTMTFTPLFPGYYKISWCPVDSQFPCEFFGELQVTGEVPVNAKPDADYFFNEADPVASICTGYCRTLLETGFDYSFSAEVTDDAEDEHLFSLSARYRGESEYEFWRQDLSADELNFTPAKSGLLDVDFRVYDGHITVDGPQFDELSAVFAVREATNTLPTTSFFIEGHSHVTASMRFEYDAASATHYPIIQYYYAETLSNDLCEPYDACDERFVDFSLYQNNKGAGSIPVFNLGDVIVFNANNSHDSDGDDLSYFWTGYIDDDAGTLNRPFLDVGEDEPRFEVTLEHVGDYYVSLCVQEKDARTLYSRPDYFTYPLDSVPNHMCPQIQVSVQEK